MLRGLPSSLPNIGYRVEGTKSKHINLTIDGDAGDWCGNFARYVDIKVNGGAGKSFLDQASHCTGIVRTTIDDYIAYASEHCVVHAGEGISDYIGSGARDLLLRIPAEVYRRISKTPRNEVKVEIVPNVGLHF